MVDRLQDMRLFRLVVQTGSLSMAGRRLGLSPAAMSSRLKAMEEHYGLRLLKRNTRGLTPTEEGQMLFEKAFYILEEVDAMDAEIKSGNSNLQGVIGLTGPMDLGRQYLNHLVEAFIAENPDVRFRLLFSDQVLNFVGRGLDIAIRFGDLPDSTLIARPLAVDRPMVCCSPAYLNRHPIPRKPEDLRQHNCLTQLRGDLALDRWGFVEDGAETTVQVSGNRMTNDGFTLRQWALEGLGIIRKGVWEVAEDVHHGRLIPLLEDYHTATTPFHILTEGGRKLPGRVRSFVDFAVAHFARLETPARGLLSCPCPPFRYQLVR